jgi:hypothetical protein
MTSGVVAALRKELDVLAVAAQDADRACVCLRGADALVQDRVEHLLRRDRLGEELRDALESSRPVGGVVRLPRAHSPVAEEIPRVSFSRSPRSTRWSRVSTKSPITTGSNGLTR